MGRRGVNTEGGFVAAVRQQEGTEILNTGKRGSTLNWRLGLWEEIADCLITKSQLGQTLSLEAKSASCVTMSASDC